jgi:predicted GNAT superfamily acetyltransferase
VDDILIRPISDIETLCVVEGLQQRVWGMDDRNLVPAHQLLASVASGGLVLGAFAAGGELIGFCYGFIGLREGRPLLHSQMTGVVAGWRGQEVGFRLKQAQREAALARGLDWMVWTFDPLQSANAYFNLRKLGAQARRYFVNYYGEMTDALNSGVDSDRLEVDWHLRSPHVVRRMEAEPSSVAESESTATADAPAALAVAGGHSLPHPGEPVLDLDTALVRIGIPSDYPAMRRQDLGLARAWRAATRRAFLGYFDRGYEAVDFVRAATSGYYVLRHADAC